jgi:Domain of unknown function (DUF4839)/PASTA domain
MRRLAATITLAILAVAVLAGCGPTASTPNGSTASTPNGSTASTPNVVGLSLDKAHQAFEALGFKEFDDKDAFENRIALVESNWAVLGQDPAAGTTVNTDTKIKLTIGKIGEDRTTARLPEGSPVLAKIRAEAAAQKADAERKAAADKAAAAKAVADKAAAAKAAASSATAAKAAVLTVKNNKDLAALLAVTDDCSDTIEGFAAKYIGRTIEFDGNIAYMNNHGDYKTRYDILVNAGNYSKTSSIGPNFQFKDVNIVNDLHLTGSNIPDSVSTGDNLHVIAQVEDYNSTQCLFFLEPVSTKVR